MYEICAIKSGLAKTQIMCVITTRYSSDLEVVRNHYLEYVSHPQKASQILIHVS